MVVDNGGTTAAEAMLPVGGVVGLLRWNLRLGLWPHLMALDHHLIISLQRKLKNSSECNNYCPLLDECI